MERYDAMQITMSKEQTKGTLESVINLLLNRSSFPNFLVSFKSWDDQAEAPRKLLGVTLAVCMKPMVHEDSLRGNKAEVAHKTTFWYGVDH